MRLQQKFISLILAMGIMAAFAPAARAVDDAILAVVNDEVITVKDLKEYMKSVFSQLRIEGKSPQEIDEVMAQYESKGIQQLIEDRLVLSAADKSGIAIRPKAVDDRLEDIKKKYPSYEEFLNAIRKEGMTITEIRKKIEDQIKGQVTVNDNVRAKVYVHPEEVTEYFNTHQDQFHSKARVYVDTIFVKTAFGKDEARDKINKALAEVKGGKDFRQVINDYSELPSVGEIAEDQLRPEFKERLDKMVVGGVSDVIDVPNGFYIIKLEGRTRASATGIMDVKDEIYQRLFEEKFRTRFNEWIESLRKKAYVEIKS